MSNFNKLYNFKDYVYKYTYIVVGLLPLHNKVLILQAYRKLQVWFSDSQGNVGDIGSSNRGH